MRPDDMPDPDSVEVRIGCERDNEAERAERDPRTTAELVADAMTDDDPAFADHDRWVTEDEALMEAFIDGLLEEAAE